MWLILRLTRRSNRRRPHLAVVAASKQVSSKGISVKTAVLATQRLTMTMSSPMRTPLSNKLRSQWSQCAETLCDCWIINFNSLIHTIVTSCNLRFFSGRSLLLTAKLWFLGPLCLSTSLGPHTHILMVRSFVLLPLWVSLALMTFPQFTKNSPLKPSVQYWFAFSLIECLVLAF